MDLTLTYARPDRGPGSGPLTVGWLRDTDKGGVIYGAPERASDLTARPREAGSPHGKSLARCPAVTQAEARLWTVPCPVDLALGFARDPEGRAAIVNRAGPSSGLRAGKLRDVVTLSVESEWRHPSRPVVQVKLPYVFLCDEPCWIVQAPPFLHYRPDPLPGLTVTGRFPISLWPRPQMWAFEWHDTTRDLVVRRGEPLFHVGFEGERPERPIQMVEAAMTAEVRAYLDHISGAVNFVGQTFRLFEAAEAARPERLVTPVARRASQGASPAGAAAQAV
jgi:hypothetical protein